MITARCVLGVQSSVHEPGDRLGGKLDVAGAVGAVDVNATASGVIATVKPRATSVARTVSVLVSPVGRAV